MSIVGHRDDELRAKTTGSWRYLNGLEDVDEGVALDEEPFLGKRGPEELRGGNRLLGEDQGGLVALRLVEGDGELVLQTKTDVESLEALRELGDGDVAVRPFLVRPVLLLVLPRRDLRPRLRSSRVERARFWSGRSAVGALFAYLLQEVGGAFALGAAEAAGLEEVEDELAGALVDDLALGEEDDVVEELEGLGRRLEEGHEDGGLAQVDDLLQAFHDLEGGGAVEAGRYFVHEQHFGRPDDHLTCIAPLQVFEFSIHRRKQEGRRYCSSTVPRSIWMVRTCGDALPLTSGDPSMHLIAHNCIGTNVQPKYLHHLTTVKRHA
ncbi:hypothetical protein BHM03_00028370 [Ensete ventricosum]|nr:hypothetical protein BHM03_00028370 [Ensete ventricosum]